MSRRSLMLIALGVAELGFSRTASAQHHHHRRHGGGEQAPSTPTAAAPDAPTTPTPAPPAAASDPEEAEYQPAIESANRGQREEALAMFQTIFERTHAPRAQARMGTTEIQLGRWLAAEEHIRSALGATQDTWVTQHREPLEEALTRVQQNLAELEVACSIEGAEVLLNGQSAGTTPLAHAARVVRGNVTIDVTAPGYEPFRQTLAVTAARARAEATLLRRVAPQRSSDVAVGRPAGAAEAQRTWQRPLAWTVLSSGVALLIIGSVEWAISAGQASSMVEATPLSAEPYGSWARFEANLNYSRERSASEVCDLAQQYSGADAAQVRDLCDSNNSARELALGLGIAGAAVGVVGAVLLVTSPSRPPATRGLSFVPSWSTSSLGGVMTWRY